MKKMNNMTYFTIKNIILIKEFVHTGGLTIRETVNLG